MATRNRVNPLGELVLTDARGAFELPGLPEGSYDIRVAHRGQRSAALGVHVGARTRQSLTIRTRPSPSEDLP